MLPARQDKRVMQDRGENIKFSGKPNTVAVPEKAIRQYWPANDIINDISNVPRPRGGSTTPTHLIWVIYLLTHV